MPADMDSLSSDFYLVYQKHETEFIESLRGYLEQEKFLDLVFICKDRIHVRAHKMVFASASTFVGDMLLTNTESVVYINLPDIDDKTLKILVTFLYEGGVKVNFNELKDLHDILLLGGIRIPDVSIRKVDTINNGENDVPLSNSMKDSTLQSQRSEAIPSSTECDATDRIAQAQSSLCYENNSFAPVVDKNDNFHNVNDQLTENSRIIESAIFQNDFDMDETPATISSLPEDTVDHNDTTDMSNTSLKSSNDTTNMSNTNLRSSKFNSKRSSVLTTCDTKVLNHEKNKYSKFQCLSQTSKGKVTKVKKASFTKEALKTNTKTPTVIKRVSFTNPGKIVDEVKNSNYNNNEISRNPVKSILRATRKGNKPLFIQDPLKKISKTSEEKGIQKDEQFCCGICKKEFVDFQSLKWHSCNGTKKFKCHKCKASFDRAIAALLHMSIHKCKTSLNCKIRGQKCQKKKTPNKDMKTHISNNPDIQKSNNKMSTQRQSDSNTKSDTLTPNNIQSEVNVRTCRVALTPIKVDLKLEAENFGNSENLYVSNMNQSTSTSNTNKMKSSETKNLPAMACSNKSVSSISLISCDDIKPSRNKCVEKYHDNGKKTQGRPRKCKTFRNYCDSKFKSSGSENSVSKLSETNSNSDKAINKVNHNQENKKDCDDKNTKKHISNKTFTVKSDLEDHKQSDMKRSSRKRSKKI